MTPKTATQIATLYKNNLFRRMQEEEEEEENVEWQKDCICKIGDVVKWTSFQITHIVRRKRMNKNIKTLFTILLMLDFFSHSVESRKKN